MLGRNRQFRNPWTFAPEGGTVRVKIQSGEDIRHLGELDRKMWTVLSCPTQGLEFDEKTLKYIDVDADGKIRVDEVIKTAQWLTRVIKDADLLLEGRDVLEFSAFNEEDPDGARLLSSARDLIITSYPIPLLSPCVIPTPSFGNAIL